ncbi:MAG: MauE/DoxX family redox-associated membrane protein [Candidatus Nanopelagicaceae bacterium]|jgi:uncharacterized membrane protein YphA (DoxX/SURF4 family)|nr:DoxX family membrane protein [Actinomycetota bacterium]
MSDFSIKGLQPWLTLISRLILGGVLLAAGLLKVTHPAKSAMAVRAYEVLPVTFANFLGYALPWIEVGIALLLILGVAVKPAALSGGLLMFLFIVAIAQAWARGLTIDCGCFGGGGQVAKGETKYLEEILRDTGLVLLALYLMKFPRGKFSLDR